jgi:hypothetical protein
MNKTLRLGIPDRLDGMPRPTNKGRKLKTKTISKFSTKNLTGQDIRPPLRLPAFDRIDHDLVILSKRLDRIERKAAALKAKEQKKTTGQS